jgi:chemotaxis protein methyltransferase CheR
MLKIFKRSQEMNRLGLKNFRLFQEFIYNNYGINYTERKADLLQSKLNKVVRRYKLSSYEELYKRLVSGKDSMVLNEFLDEITIHKTDFFREKAHFEFLKQNIKQIIKYNPVLSKQKEMRVWSAACSTGEEPYSIAMILREVLPVDYALRILASDISRKVLITAQLGRYPLSAANDIDQPYLSKYLCQENNQLLIKPELKELIAFRQFNLMRPFPFQNKFDLIFCRNVMIYFDNNKQNSLAQKFYNALNDGGILILGLAETLRSKTAGFKPLGPSVYLKN